MSISILYTKKDGDRYVICWSNGHYSKVDKHFHSKVVKAVERGR